MAGETDVCTDVCQPTSFSLGTASRCGRHFLAFPFFLGPSLVFKIGHLDFMLMAFIIIFKSLISHPKISFDIGLQSLSH